MGESLSLAASLAEGGVCIITVLEYGRLSTQPATFCSGFNLSRTSSNVGLRGCSTYSYTESQRDIFDHPFQCGLLIGLVVSSNLVDGEGCIYMAVRTRRGGLFRWASRVFGMDGGLMVARRWNLVAGGRGVGRGVRQRRSRSIGLPCADAVFKSMKKRVEVYAIEGQAVYSTRSLELSSNSESATFQYHYRPYVERIQDIRPDYV
ncbi:hypothetical protein Tco_1299687 [Tanacetum coccineum]